MLTKIYPETFHTRSGRKNGVSDAWGVGIEWVCQCEDCIQIRKNLWNRTKDLLDWKFKINKNNSDLSSNKIYLKNCCSMSWRVSLIESSAIENWELILIAAIGTIKEKVNPAKIITKEAIRTNHFVIGSIIYY